MVVMGKDERRETVGSGGGVKTERVPMTRQQHNGRRQPREGAMNKNTTPPARYSNGKPPVSDLGRLPTLGIVQSRLSTFKEGRSYPDYICCA